MTFILRTISLCKPSSHPPDFISMQLIKFIWLMWVWFLYALPVTTSKQLKKCNKMKLQTC